MIGAGPFYAGRGTKPHWADRRNQKNRCGSTFLLLAKCELPPSLHLRFRPFLSVFSFRCPDFSHPFSFPFFPSPLLSSVPSFFPSRRSFHGLVFLPALSTESSKKKKLRGKPKREKLATHPTLAFPSTRKAQRDRKVIRPSQLNN